MTTSGVTTWTVTAGDVIRAALGEGGILDPGSEPEDEEFGDCLLRLNGLLKSWAMRGVSLSRESEATITTTAATAKKTLSAGVRAVSNLRLVVSATYERPLFQIGRSDYLGLPNKAAVGQPTMYYISRQNDAVDLYLWPVSAAAATLKADIDRLPETVTATAETLDIRQELYETVWANLAVRIAGLFGETPKPELVARAATLEMQMLDAERPDVYRFEAEHDYA